MLTSWSIKNFKPIVDSGELQLAPVTVFAGRNSSGKSSLLQSILMIAQTLESRLLDRPLLPNGRLVQLGKFEDIISEYSDSKTLELEFEIEFKKRGVVFDEDEVDVDDEGNLFIRGDPKLKSVRTRVSFQCKDQKTQITPIVDNAYIFVDRFFLKIALYEADMFKLPAPDFNLINIYLAFIKASEEEHHVIHGIVAEKKEHYQYSPGPLPYIGRLTHSDQTGSLICRLSLAHFLPDHLLQSIQAKDRADIKRLDELLPHGLPQSSAEQSPTGISALPTGYTVYAASSETKNVKYAVEEITNFFAEKMRYLGPLRTDPGIIQQQFAPTSELDNVGLKGEYAAIAYHTNRNAFIDWYNPQTQQIEKNTLQLALDTWAHYLNIAERISTVEAGSIGITWQIISQKGHKPHSLHEVGVGISQILPILIMGLLSPTNSLLIIEQPELHLHPYVQARLGDFFMGLAKCKKQCLIETHSENLVSQLRLHIVQAGGLEQSDCMIYFVDQDERGAAKFEQVEISPNGNILNWPDGFFDETMLQEDRITATSVRKRAQEAKHGS